MSQFDALMEAIKSNDEAAALKAAAAINLSDDRPGPDSPILQALYRGMEQVPAALVAHGYAPSLIEAAAMGDAAATKERAEAGEDLTLKSPDGWTAPPFWGGRKRRRCCSRRAPIMVRSRPIRQRTIRCMRRSPVAAMQRPSRR
jgi:hypothetical protein